MGKEVLNSVAFEALLARINQETHLTENKLKILYASQGFFSAQQAARILFAFGISADKLSAIRIMEPRLTQMTSNDARDVIAAFSIHADKVKALEYIRRYITDYRSTNGFEYIMSAFQFEDDKMRASCILNTADCPATDTIPAGGHQGYAALGGLYTQCRPLVPHLYGNVNSQRNNMMGSLQNSTQPNEDQCTERPPQTEQYSRF